jgi:LPS sulfotransferase NodH
VSFKRFCIFASQRTGSSYLASALDSHPEIICHKEVFHPYGVQSHSALISKLSPKERSLLLDRGFRDRDPLVYLDTLIQQSAMYFPEVRSIGFKLFTSHNELVWREMLAADVIKIFLYRENKLDQYASDKIASTTGCYASLEPGRTPQVKVEFDFEEFVAFVQATAGSFWEDLKTLRPNGLPPFIIEYEQVATLDMVPLLELLGVDSKVRCQSPLQKQNSRITSDKFSNFEYLVSCLEGTAYERWIVG